MPTGRVDASKPLRPLSAYAWSTLAYCGRTPMVVSWESNPGVWGRLMREGLVEQVPATKGVWYQITTAGRERLKERS